MDDLVSREAVKKWLERWDGYVDMDIIRRMQYRANEGAVGTSN